MWNSIVLVPDHCLVCLLLIIKQIDKCHATYIKNRVPQNWKTIFFYIFIFLVHVFVPTHSICMYVGPKVNVSKNEGL